MVIWVDSGKASRTGSNGKTDFVENKETCQQQPQQHHHHHHQQVAPTATETKAWTSILQKHHHTLYHLRYINFSDLSSTSQRFSESFIHPPSPLWIWSTGPPMFIKSVPPAPQRSLLHVQSQRPIGHPPDPLQLGYIRLEDNEVVYPRVN